LAGMVNSMCANKGVSVQYLTVSPVHTRLGEGVK
jgi:hypothetical protein